MSFKAQQWVLEQEGIRGFDKWVLFMLAYRDNHDEPHGCWPSLGRMAKDCGLSRSTVQAAMERLKKSGMLKVENRKDPKGDPDSNYYTLPLVWVYRETVHPIPAGGTPVYRQAVTNHKRNLKVTEVRTRYCKICGKTGSWHLNAAKRGQVDHDFSEAA